MKISGRIMPHFIFAFLIIMAVYIFYLTLFTKTGQDKIYQSLEIIIAVLITLFLWAVVCTCIKQLLIISQKQIDVYKYGLSKYTILLLIIGIGLVFLRSNMLEQVAVIKANCSLLHATTCLSTPAESQALTEVDKRSMGEQEEVVNKLIKARVTANVKFISEFNRIELVGNELNKEMTSYFSASNLVTQEGSDKAAIFIPNYRKYVAEKNDLLLAYQNEISKELASCGIKDNDFWYSYNKSKTDGEKLISILYATDNMILDIMENMLVFIKINREHAKAVNNQLVFDSAALDEEYQYFIKNINELSELENSVVFQIQNERNSAIQGMEKVIGS